MYLVSLGLGKKKKKVLLTFKPRYNSFPTYKQRAIPSNFFSTFRIRNL